MRETSPRLHRQRFAAENCNFMRWTLRNFAALLRVRLFLVKATPHDFLSSFCGAVVILRHADWTQLTAAMHMHAPTYLGRFSYARWMLRARLPALAWPAPNRAVSFYLLQCWENCQLLQSNFPVWGAMCSEKSICVSISFVSGFMRCVEVLRARTGPARSAVAPQLDHLARGEPPPPLQIRFLRNCNEHYYYFLFVH